MRIDSIVAQLLAPIAPLPATDRRVQSGGGAGQDPGSFNGRSRLGVPQVERSFTSTPQLTLNPPEALGGDRAEFSPIARNRLARQAPAESPAEQPAKADPFADGVSIVDNFVRQRAVIAYRFPARNAFSPSIDFTLDVEVAYRRIDIVPTNSLDVQA